MCLLNVYQHGYHSISAHSDDERQMGESHNVYCWVIGDNPRKAIFKSKDKTKSFTIEIPEGLYIMSGKNFQKNFTHEFPKMYESTYKEALKHVPEMVGNEYKPDWVYDHREEIEKKLRGTKHFTYV